MGNQDMRKRLLATTLAAGAIMASTAAHAQTSAADAANPPTGLIESQTAAPASADAGPSNQAEIVVTGSRIVSPNLQSASPITAVNAQELRLSGTTRVEDIVNSLPQAAASQSSGISNGSDGTATLNLRNLGDTRTLVLVDGHRLPPGDPSREAGSVLGSAVDVNNVPAFLVKRIDVLTGGASAAYGADAVAGVVNFILDRDFTGLKADLQGSLYAHNNASYVGDIVRADPRNFSAPHGPTNDGATYDASLAYGAKFAGGRGHVTIYGSYHHQDAVLQSARDYSACALDTTNSTVSRRDNLVCFGSRNSAVANFLTDGGLADTGAGAFIIDSTTQGRTTRDFGDSDRYNYGPTNYYQRPDRRYNAGGFASFDLSDAFKPYIGGSYMDDKSVAQVAPSGTFGNLFTLNCGNPLLSPGVATALGCATFGPGTLETVQSSIFKRNVEGGPRQDSLQHRAFRIIGGAKGDLSKTWSYDAYAQLGKTIYREEYLNDFSFSRTRLALNDCLNADGTPVGDTSCVPYNIFTGSTRIQPTAADGVTQAAIDYVNTPGRKSGYTREFVASGVLNGRLGDYGIQSPFAADGVAVAIGGEYRRENLKLNTDLEYATGDLLGQGAETKPTRGHFDVKEAFIETNIPLADDKPGFQRLDVDLAYRYSYYSTVHHTNTWKIGVDWTPFAGEASALRFRGSINRAVRAPTLQDLFAPNQLGLSGSDDPCADVTGDADAVAASAAACANTGRNDPNFANHYGKLVSNPASQYNGRTVGAITAGSSLKPEVAITQTIGMVLAPTSGMLRGASLSVDYYHINLRDTIKTDGFDTIFNQCLSTGSDYYCDLVRRDPTNGSLWLGPGGYVLDPIYNAGRLRDSGIDVDASYVLRTDRFGRFDLGFTGSYLLQQKVEVLTHNTDGSLSSEGFYDCKGYYGVNCGVPSPRWRHNLRVTWTPSDSGLGISGNWRHIGGTRLEAADPNPLQPASGSGAGPFDRIRTYDYFDLALTASVNNQLQLRLGVNNMFDKDPPIVNGNALTIANVNGNTFPGAYDALGRYVFVGITARY